MTRDEKVRIAKALERLRVDVIEAGLRLRAQVILRPLKRSPQLLRNRQCAAFRARLTVISKSAEAIASAPRRRFTHSSQPVQFI